MAPAPTNRTTPVRIARGSLAALQAGLAVLKDGEITWAEDQRQFYMVEGTGVQAVLTPAASSVMASGFLLGAYNGSTGRIAALSPAASAAPRQGFAVNGRISAGSGQEPGDFFLVSVAGTPSGDAAAINVPLNANDRVVWTGSSWTVIASGSLAGTTSLHSAADVSDTVVSTVPAEFVKGLLVRDNRVADGLPGAYKLVDSSPFAGGGGVSLGSTAPTGPSNGQLWWKSNTSALYIWFDADGSGSNDPGEWLPIVTPGAVGEASVSLAGVVRLASAEMIASGTAGRVVDAAQMKAAIAAATPDASITAKGLARLADATAITAGVAGRVVDAAQLQAAVNAATPADATTSVKGVVQLADGAAITAGTAGRVVDAAQLKAATQSVVAPEATTSTAGVVRLADAMAISAGTAGRIVDAAQLKAAAAAATAPDATASVKGVVQLADATAISSGSGGRVVDAAQLKEAVATAGRASVGATAPASPGSGQLWWDPVAEELFIYAGGQWSQTVTPLSIGDATTAVAGVVRLADAAAITAGTAYRVVDAGQLKSAISAAVVDATSSIKGIVRLADAAAISAGTSGRIVDAAQLQGAITASIVDATTASRGVVRLADTAAIAAGTVERVIDSAQLKTATDACLKRNISTLPVLP